MFDVYRGDGTEPYTVRTKDGDTMITEQLKDLESASSGVFWVGVLPYGTYYIHETVVPGSVQQNGDEGWWYVLEVKETEVTCSAKETARPTAP